MVPIRFLYTNSNILTILAYMCIIYRYYSCIVYMVIKKKINSVNSTYIVSTTYPVSGDANEVRLAVTLPALTRNSTSPSGSTSADTVSATAAGVLHSNDTAATTTTAAAARCNSVDPRFMPFGWIADADTVQRALTDGLPRKIGLVD